MAAEEIVHPSFRYKFLVTRFSNAFGHNVRVCYENNKGIKYGRVLTIGAKNLAGVPRTDAMCVEEAIEMLMSETV